MGLRLLALFGDFFNQVDDAAAQLRLLDPREGLGQRQAFQVARKSDT